MTVPEDCLLLLLVCILLLSVRFSQSKNKGSRVKLLRGFICNWSFIVSAPVLKESCGRREREVLI